MRLKNVVSMGSAGLIIYISENEKNDSIIIQKINELKKIYKNLAVFVSGDKEMKEVLGCFISSKRGEVL